MFWDYWKSVRELHVEADFFLEKWQNWLNAIPNSDRGKRK